MGGSKWNFRRLITLRRMVLVFCMLAASASNAQTVYRCEAKGQVSYAHEPCVGAKAIDTTPTQGLDKSSGKSRKGAEVRRAELDKVVGEAIRPLTGMDATQRAKHQRRFKLPTAAKLECDLLDNRLERQATAERTARPESLPAAQQALFESRQRYRELGC